jgi:integrative and conjugative element protein (TIGR02256 family)
VPNKKEKVLVRLSNDALNLITAEMYKWYPKETGGVLIGSWVNKKEVIISDIIGPGPNAIHTYTSFTPDDAYHINVIARIYTESQCKQTYLGDWHTHPNEKAYLSELDKKTLRKIAGYKPARLTRPLMLVLGTNPMEYKIWLHSYGGLLQTSNIVSCIVEKYI